MKFLIPPDKVCREIKSRLYQYFRTEEVEFFNAALNLYCHFYEVPVPTVTWFQRLDDVRAAGFTYSNGKIELIAAEFWKRNRKHKGMVRWVEVVYHELYHYLFWVSDELKADEYAKAMMGNR